MGKPKKPVVGQTDPTFPPASDLTPDAVLQIACMLLTKDRERRLSRLSRESRLRERGGQ